MEKLRFENEELRNSNRKLQMISLNSHEYIEEEYPTEDLNIRVSVQRDEDS